MIKIYRFCHNFSLLVEDALLHISLENEITRREFLIAPVIAEVRRLTKAKLRSEYWFEYNHQLKGSLDYFLRSTQNLLVIEAKDADMTRGFTQLSTEMIALDKADETPQKIIYGAITTGNIWQFGKLEREQKLILQDIKTYDLLEDLEILVRSLVGNFRGKMKINHLGIATKSIAEALTFWENALGLENVHTEIVEDQKVRVAMLPLGESRIELLEATGADSPIAKFIEKRGGGIHHIAVEVEDIAAKLAELKAKGMRLIDETPRTGAENCLVAFVHPGSTNGVLLELVQKM